MMTVNEYRVEIEREGCKKCGEGTQWEVYDSQDMGIGGLTFGLREDAEHLRDLLNDAYALGQRDGKRQTHDTLAL